MGSAGCQPAGAGSLPATFSDAQITFDAGYRAMRLGKLPRRAGWQPALPKHPDALAISLAVLVTRAAEAFGPLGELGVLDLGEENVRNTDRRSES